MDILRRAKSIIISVNVVELQIQKCIRYLRGYMVEIRLYKDDKDSALSCSQEPFRIMIVPTLDIDNSRCIFTVPSINGKELISFYFLQYTQVSEVFYFYKVDERIN